jgi:hypothetical protein
MISAALTLMLFAVQTMSMAGVENSVGSHASGTSVEPRTVSESSSMIHKTLGNWTLMFHANAFVVDVQQTGLRGRDKFFSGDWVMPALSRQSGRHGFLFRTMLSLEPATITNRRYPLLFQTGETAYGLSITDGQHPHDLLMELAGKYEFRLDENLQFFAYGGPVGEAALGPPAFPHRASASENPLATLGHHSQDSTHIATNVVTLGIVRGRLQVEGSAFHGREPNENRWNIDYGKPDSFAARVTVAPLKSVTAQVSSARINNPEAVDTNLDIVRTTASVHHNIQFSSGHVSSSVIFGRNKILKNGARRIFNSYGFEATAKFLRRNWVWTRIENVDRDRTLLPPPPPAPACTLCGILGFGGVADHRILGPNGQIIIVPEDPIGRVQAYTLGYERELPSPSWISVGLGTQATAYNLPPQLRTVYGERPATFAFFLRFRPVGNMGAHMKLMHQGQ